MAETGNRDKFSVCPHCGSNVCYDQLFQTEDGLLESKTCLTCGYTTNSMMKEGSEYERALTERQPKLYQDLRFVDQEGFVWYPSVFAEPTKGMVYIDISKNEKGEPCVQWAATPMRELTPKEARMKKYKGMKYVADTKNTKTFGLLEFMNAAISIGMFD